MNIVSRPAQLGAIPTAAAFIEGAKELFSPKGGRIIETPGQAAALSMGAVAALGGALLLVVLLKQKKIL
jgi:hypothetical protein